MGIREEKVLLSADGYGRIAIVRRSDALFVLYEHWRWPPEIQTAFNVAPVENSRWTDAYDPRLYDDDTVPVPGVYGTVEDAEKEAVRLLATKAHM